MSDKMRDLVQKIAALQSRYYGDGMALHIHMIGWAAKAREALAEQPAQSNVDLAVLLTEAAKRGATPAEVRSQRIGYIAAETGASRETVEALLIASGCIAEQPAQGEAVVKARLWDTLNAALMSRSGITLDNERDCYEAARQWAEAHDDASSCKAAVQKLREERDTIAALKVEAVTLSAPPAPSVPKRLSAWAKHESGDPVTDVQIGYESARRDVAAMLASAPPAPSVPEGWREFIADCATTAGKMVNGNRLSERAAGLLAAAAPGAVPCP